MQDVHEEELGILVVGLAPLHFLFVSNKSRKKMKHV